MRALCFISIVLLNLASCAEIPQIPNLSAKSLREIPPKHREIIAEIAADHREYCYFKLGRNFAQRGDKIFGTGFFINESSLETLKISFWNRASVLYQNFQCDGLNPWKATSAIKVFILVNDRVYTAWVSGALFTKKKQSRTIVVLPQDQILCREGQFGESCNVEIYWDGLRSKFTSLSGPMILTPYARAFE